MCQYNGLNGDAFSLNRAVKLGPSDAARLAVAADASQLSQLDDAQTSCPMADGSIALLVFSYHGRADIDLWYAFAGCPTISNGHIVAQPSGALQSLVDPRAPASSSAP